MITVKVIRQSSGTPLKGVRVTLSFSGLLRGNATEMTDGNGNANFSNETGSGTIYVNGKEVYKGKLSGLIPIYI